MREMLYARCLSKAIRRIAPDVMMGFYLTEEIVDSENIPESKVKRNDEGFVMSID